jgi:hypothetical protein
MKKWFMVLLSLVLLVSLSGLGHAGSEPWSKYLTDEQVAKIKELSCRTADDSAQCQLLAEQLMRKIFTAGSTSFSSAIEMKVAAQLVAQTETVAGVTIAQAYEFWAYDKDGNLKWTASIPHNMVMTEGLNAYLACTLKTGACTPTLYMGLVTGPGSGTTYALGNTLASHAGWTENTDYTGNRQAVVLGSISGGSVSNAASKAVFPITGSATIAGAFVCSAATGTSGTLYGGDDFTGGDRSVVSGDTVNGQVTFTVANP